MGSIVVDVMLKPEILDPQGQAVGGALPRLGFEGFTDVRQGKRFVLTVDGDVTDEHLTAAREAAEKLLSNPVIEDVVSVHVLDDSVDDSEPSPAEAKSGRKARARAEAQAAADGEPSAEAEGDRAASEDESQ
ncbi:phosphoribosylformylglycinamidine synthase PurS subunit [Humibacillus xanthopallidus]|uniref:Phosphoribosylformylglycinamidine synthase subunit PurS n=1 Tax=Humibacillus xanthopallidus TaxID=412689 RepID=A0A543HTN8_9MICO|nr:phosphoribosylformylglycinamidine synthase PurS subunit [Humibacillus xanthopallidus]